MKGKRQFWREDARKWQPGELVSARWLNVRFANADELESCSLCGFWQTLLRTKVQVSWCLCRLLSLALCVSFFSCQEWKLPQDREEILKTSFLPSVTFNLGHRYPSRHSPFPPAPSISSSTRTNLQHVCEHTPPETSLGPSFSPS